MKTFRTRTYSVSDHRLPAGRSVTFAVLADLHGLVFGNNHQQLYAAIAEGRPDAILVCGDMIVNHRHETMESAAGLLLRLCDRVPIFYALGNHEYKMLLNPESREFYLNYERLLTSAGICFLHNEHVDICLGDTDFVFYGLELPLEYYHKPNSPALSLTFMEKLIGIPSQSGIHVLLAHNPKYGNTYFSWGADLILSGHYHGGIMRLSEHHGLTCPQYLLFPPYCCGDFQKGRQHMIVSAGLGEHTIPVRIHNPRELLFVKIHH
ncbi:metallophosphoesterase [Blautia sp. MSJ-19]|uniref:metallophosphoesterase n=1 Tax=Blautia sp. MSJ-19 TaxID=2841517 RepID=UPI001C0EF2A2|nr:metallophosphoesterase [Blautia sp. MSJ-19]MBU5481912.1 metallophosphoesterase [Blautia sp. MSJ-19]